MYRVLSIDGGGIRGLLPARVLAWLEDRTGRPTTELFDLVVGTSTGAILGAGLCTPGIDGRPRFRAEDLAELYLVQGPRIFTRPVVHRVRTANGVLGPRYPATELQDVLDESFAQTWLSEALVPLVIPAYETERRGPWFFRSARAVDDPGHDFLLRDAIRAATAAPTFFPPARITSATDEAWTLLDGGLFANDPAMAALVEALDVPDVEDVVIVSLGTGELTRPLRYEEIRSWGLLRWARPVLEVVFDAVNRTVDAQVSRLVGSTERLERYDRLQPLLTTTDAIDDASPANLAALERLAAELIADEQATLEELAELLTG